MCVACLVRTSPGECTLRNVVTTCSDKRTSRIIPLGSKLKVRVYRENFNLPDSQLNKKKKREEERAKKRGREGEEGGDYQDIDSRRWYQPLRLEDREFHRGKRIRSSSLERALLSPRRLRNLAILHSTRHASPKVYRVPKTNRGATDCSCHEFE